MNNPRTIDRRDVAHPTNPIGGHDHIENDKEATLVAPLNGKAVRPSQDRDAAISHPARGTSSADA